MGYIKHHTIVVTHWDDKKVLETREKAVEIFKENFSNDLHCDGDLLVSPVIYGLTNGYCSFFIAPDGSKEGWGTSDSGNNARKEFLDWLKKEDNYCDYIEVVFGGDDDREGVIRSKDFDLKEEETEI